MTPATLLSDPGLMAVLAALPQARLVGGCVRDMLAGQPVVDIDIATPDLPEDVLRLLRQAGLRGLPTGLAHGTVTALVDGRSFEVTTLRRDIATNGRHAEVTFTDDWQTDAARRDFTINAMSLDRDGVLYDWFAGQEDLRAGRVRFVGDPATRIAEDYLRILRFFRFHARYGRGAPDAAALMAIGAGVAGLARLSPERVWQELRRILAAPDPRATLRLMQQTGVLAAILPDGADLAALDRLVAVQAPADPLLRLAALDRGDPDAVAARLRLSRAEAVRLASLRAPPPVPEWLIQALADTPADILHGRLFLSGAPVARHAALDALVAPVFPLQGRDLAVLGVSPGPAMGTLLRAVRFWWLEGGCLADAAACLAEAARRHHVTSG